MQPYYPHPSRILFGLASLLMLPEPRRRSHGGRSTLPERNRSVRAGATGRTSPFLPGSRFRSSPRGLNAPTGIAFLGNQNQFQVYVLESGHGLPSQCTEQGSAGRAGFSIQRTRSRHDILVFDQSGRKITGPIGKPTSAGGGFQPAGPAVDIAFEHGFQGGPAVRQRILTKQLMAAAKTAALASSPSTFTRGS